MIDDLTVPAPIGSAAHDAYDLVVQGGRVIDPDTGLDAISNIGIVGSQITSVTSAPLSGRRVVEAHGLIVAPGFIDLHSHGQAIAEFRLQALDGVTTALELEAGAAPVSFAYRQSEAEGRPINFGFSASWAAVRMHVIGGEPMLGWTMARANRLGSDTWRVLASTNQIAAMLHLLERELCEGALGIGIMLGYAPATDPDEYLAVARLAATAGVATYTHARPLIEQDPGVIVDGAEEIVRAAATTGAHMHYCHINSTSTRHLDRVPGPCERRAQRGRSSHDRGIPLWGRDERHRG